MTDINDSEYEILNGGNMNKPLKKDNLVFKNASEASETIHKLLIHVRNKGINWIPESFGINEDGKHVLSYIEGMVPEDTLNWLWKEDLLIDIATRLRQWHDATEDFKCENETWLLENDEPNEVICHSDFAPYNCVFENKKFKGLIDFDVCAPGSRLWDIVYTVYRFVPILPQEKLKPNYDISPFNRDEMFQRLNLFLESYSMSETKFLYKSTEVLKLLTKRLIAIHKWSKDYGIKTDNQEMIKDSEMYLYHANWVNDLY